MKLVVFAHTPPPFHGQSWMVQLMLEGLGKPHTGSAAQTHGCEILCYHVNARLSAELADIGRARWRKVFRLLGYCLQALWIRVRHAADILYFVPAAPIRASLYRDWLVMILCRVFFRQVIYHWHAPVGLGEWLSNYGRSWEQIISHALMDRVDLAIVLSKFNQAHAMCFQPRKVAVVCNGIPDPCPNYALILGERRTARVAIRRQMMAGGSRGNRAVSDDRGVVQVLFMAHCVREKGLFDALEAVRLANGRLAAQGMPLQMRLTVAGGFMNMNDHSEFERILASAGNDDWLHYAGFVSGEQKATLLHRADLLCHPTYCESFGLVLLEAMAYGIPIVTTRYGSIPEILPPDYPGLVDPRAPTDVASAMLRMMVNDCSELLRERFLSHFTIEKHLAALRGALSDLKASQ